MNKKRVFVVLGILFLLLAFALVAKAQDNDSNNSTDQNNTNVTIPTNKTIEVDNETAKETEDMHTHFGAQVRLLQLEKQIRRRILWAGAVIDFLNNKSVNATELEGIKAELVLLADEAHAAVSAPYSNESVKKFVDIKLDAKDLIKEFREKARQYLTDSDRSVLSEKFRSIDRDELKELNQQVKDKVRELNAERVEKMHERMNISDGNLTRRVKNGEISERDALMELRNEAKNLSAREKREFRSKMMKDEEDKMNFRLNNLIKIQEDRLSRVSERLLERADELRNSNAAQRVGESAKALAERANELARQRAAMIIRRGY